MHGRQPIAEDKAKRALRRPTGHQPQCSFWGAPIWASEARSLARVRESTPLQPL